MSDTPKTNAVAFYITNERVRREAVFADFARAQELDLNEALRIINDYYWVESRRKGQEVDERAGRLLKKVGML